jgi:hypothetical protein
MDEAVLRYKTEVSLSTPSHCKSKVDLASSEITNLVWQADVADSRGSVLFLMIIRAQRVISPDSTTSGNALQIMHAALTPAPQEAIQS